MPMQRRPQRTPVSAACIAACLGLAFAGAAWAQAQPAPAPAAAPAADTATQGQSPQQSRSSSAAPETITVTATRRNEQAIKVPFNITAISEETLREENITDLKSLIQNSVAINAPENPARFADSVTVRGLNVSPVNANNLEQFVKSTLSYYLDDTPLPNIGYRIKDIARVEELLGPQGTLYGAGALGGTYRYITNKPRLGKTELRVNTSFYKRDNGGLSNDTDVVINLPLGTDLAFRASLARLDEKGWVDRVSNPPWRTGANAWSTKPDASKNVYEDDDWQEVNGGRLSLLWRASPRLQVLVAHTQQEQFANGTSAVSKTPLGIANARTPAEVLAAWQNPQRTVAQQPCQPNCQFTSEAQTPYAVNDHSIISRYPEFADRQFRLSSVDISYDFGWAALHSSTSKFRDARVGQADYASQGWSFYAPESPILGGYDLGGSIRSDRSAYMTFDNTFSGLSHETRLTSKGQGAWDWIGGIYHTEQNRNFVFSEVLPGMDAWINRRPGGVGKVRASPLPDVGYTEDLGSQYRETAVFGEIGYRITPRWRVNAGARVFRYTDTASVVIIDYAGGVVDRTYSATESDSGNAYYKLNTSFDLSPDLLTYLTWSQGFRRGGTNPFFDRGATRVVQPGARRYEPDSTDNLKLGLKGYLFNRQMAIQASIYQIDWNDPQTYRSQDVNGFPVNGTANGPDAQSRGAEFSMRWRLTPWLQATYSTATTEAKWVDTKTHCIFTDAAPVASRQCRTWSAGGLMGGAPKWRHNLALRFQHTFANDVYFWTSLSARYTGPIQVDRADNVAQNLTIERYQPNTRYALSGGLSKGDWDLSMRISNLTNLRVVSSVQAGGIMGSREISPQPRTVFLNASYRFK